MPLGVFNPHNTPSREKAHACNINNRHRPFMLQESRQDAYRGQRSVELCDLVPV